MSLPSSAQKFHHPKLASLRVAWSSFTALYERPTAIQHTGRTINIPDSQMTNLSLEPLPCCFISEANSHHVLQNPVKETQGQFCDYKKPKCRLPARAQTMVFLKHFPRKLPVSGALFGGYGNKQSQPQSHLFASKENKKSPNIIYKKKKNETKRVRRRKIKLRGKIKKRKSSNKSYPKPDRTVLERGRGKKLDKL